MVNLSDIAKSLMEMDVATTEELTEAAIDANIPAEEILEKGLVAGIEVVGHQFEAGQIFLPELLMVGEAAKAGVDSLKSCLLSSLRNDGIAE